MSINSNGSIPLWINGTLTGNSADTAHLGQTLASGQGLISLNGRYRAVVQGDGNFVIYGPQGAAWQSGTSGMAAVDLVFQFDSNLVMYQGDGPSIWSAGTNGTSADHLVMQNDGNLVLYGPTAAKWVNGRLLGTMPTTVGVYAYPSPIQALQDGWPLIGETGAVGTCQPPFTGQGFTKHSGDDEKTGIAIRSSHKTIPWLSFWTVSGPSLVDRDGKCTAAPIESPVAFYLDGYAAGRWVARQVDHYAADGLNIKPSAIILDPEGYPDSHSGLDHGIGSGSGPSANQLNRWVSMLIGWKSGMNAVDPTLTPAFYADETEYVKYNLKRIPESAFESHWV